MSSSILATSSFCCSEFTRAQVFEIFISCCVWGCKLSKRVCWFCGSERRECCGFMPESKSASQSFQSRGRSSRKQWCISQRSQMPRHLSRTLLWLPVTVSSSASSSASGAKLMGMAILAACRGPKPWPVERPLAKHPHGTRGTSNVLSS